MSEFSERRNTLCIMAAILEGARFDSADSGYISPSVELAQRLASQVDEAMQAMEQGKGLER